MLHISVRCFWKNQLGLNLWALPLSYHLTNTWYNYLTTTPPQKIHSTRIYHHYTSTLLPSTTKGLELLTVTSAKMVQLLLVCEDVYKATEPSCVNWCQPFCLWWNGHACLLIHQIFRWLKRKSGTKTHLDRSVLFLLLFYWGSTYCELSSVIRNRFMQMSNQSLCFWYTKWCQIKGYLKSILASRCF